MPTTYTQRDINSDCTSQATDLNKKLLEATAAEIILTLSLSGGDTKSLAFYTEPSVPNLTEWPAGDYEIQIDVRNAGADITYILSLIRVNSGCTLQETLGTLGSLSGTGLKNFTVNKAAIATAVGDRLVGKVEATRGASHGNQKLDMAVNIADSKVVGPWSVGTTFFETLAVIEVATPVLSSVPTFGKSIAVTAISTVVLSLVSTFARVLSVVNTGVAAVSIVATFFRTLAATVSSIATLAKGIVSSVTMAAVSTALTVLSATLVSGVSIVATAIGNAALATVSIFSQTIAATATGIVSIFKLISKFMIATAVGLPTFAKAISKILAVTATGTASLARIRLSSISIASIATGLASLTAEIVSGAQTISKAVMKILLFK